MPNGLLNILLLLAFFGADSFFGDFFEVVLQAMSAMFVTNYPRGYAKVGFCYSQTEKISSKLPQNSSMFEIVPILCRQIATKWPWNRR